MEEKESARLVRNDETKGRRQQSAFDFDFGFLQTGTRLGGAAVRAFEKISELEPQISSIGGESHTSLEVDDGVADKFLDDAIEVLHAIGIAVAHSVQQCFAFAFTLLDVFTRSHRGF